MGILISHLRSIIARDLKPKICNPETDRNLKLTSFATSLQLSLDFLTWQVGNDASVSLCPATDQSRYGCMMHDA